MKLIVEIDGETHQSEQIYEKDLKRQKYLESQGEGCLMATPKVSIIVPLYNQSQKLMACLQSIKNQTIQEGERFRDLEVIIVNDGSTDITSGELEKRIRLHVFTSSRLIHQTNQSAPVARNNGFAQSRGHYILFCDADVVMKPTMLEKMVKALDENSQVSYVYSSFKFGWKKFKLWEFDAERLRQMPYIHTTSLIRRECLSGFSAQGGPWDPNLKRLQDWDLWLTMLEQGHVGQWIPEVLFTVKSGGTMSKWRPSFFVAQESGYQQAVGKIKQKHNLP